MPTFCSASQGSGPRRPADHDRAPAGHRDRLRRQAASGPRRRRPGDAQYPARPPSRQRRRGGSRRPWPTAARSNRSGSGPATRRPPPYRALTGRSTPPAASYPPVTCKIDVHPRLVHPPPEVSEVAGTVSSVNTLRQRCRCRWNLPKHAPERDSAAGRHAYKGAAPRPHCGSEFPGDDHRIHARLRQSLVACGHFWPDAISQQVCEGGRSPAVGM